MMIIAQLVCTHTKKQGMENLALFPKKDIKNHAPFSPKRHKKSCPSYLDRKMRQTGVFVMENCGQFTANYHKLFVKIRNLMSILY